MLNEQLQLAIRVLSDEVDLETSDRSYAEVAADLQRLATLIVELDDWRSKGGAGPYGVVLTAEPA